MDIYWNNITSREILTRGIKALARNNADIEQRLMSKIGSAEFSATAALDALRVYTHLTLCAYLANRNTDITCCENMERENLFAILDHESTKRLTWGDGKVYHPDLMWVVAKEEHRILGVHALPRDIHFIEVKTVLTGDVELHYESAKKNHIQRRADHFIIIRLSDGYIYMKDFAPAKPFYESSIFMVSSIAISVHKYLLALNHRVSLEEGSQGRLTDVDKEAGQKRRINKYLNPQAMVQRGGKVEGPFRRWKEEDYIEGTRTKPFQVEAVENLQKVKDNLTPFQPNIPLPLVESPNPLRPEFSLVPWFPLYSKPVQIVFGDGIMTGGMKDYVMENEWDIFDSIATLKVSEKIRTCGIYDSSAISLVRAANEACNSIELDHNKKSFGFRAANVSDPEVIHYDYRTAELKEYSENLEKATTDIDAIVFQENNPKETRASANVPVYTRLGPTNVGGGVRIPHESIRMNKDLLQEMWEITKGKLKDISTRQVGACIGAISRLSNRLMTRASKVTENAKLGASLEMIPIDSGLYQISDTELGTQLFGFFLRPRLRSGLKPVDTQPSGLLVSISQISEDMAPEKVHTMGKIQLSKNSEPVDVYISVRQTTATISQLMECTKVESLITGLLSLYESELSRHMMNAGIRSVNGQTGLVMEAAESEYMVEYWEKSMRYLSEVLVRKMTTSIKVQGAIEYQFLDLITSCSSPYGECKQLNPANFVRKYRAEVCDTESLEYNHLHVALREQHLQKKRSELNPEMRDARESFIDFVKRKRKMTQRGESWFLNQNEPLPCVNKTEEERKEKKRKMAMDLFKKQEEAREAMKNEVYETRRETAANRDSLVSMLSEEVTRPLEKDKQTLLKVWEGEVTLREEFIGKEVEITRVKNLCATESVKRWLAMIRESTDLYHDEIELLRGIDNPAYSPDENGMIEAWAVQSLYCYIVLSVAEGNLDWENFSPRLARFNHKKRIELSWTEESTLITLQQTKEIDGKDCTELFEGRVGFVTHNIKHALTHFLYHIYGFYLLDEPAVKQTLYKMGGYAEFNGRLKEDSDRKRGLDSDSGSSDSDSDMDDDDSNSSNDDME